MAELLDRAERLMRVQIAAMPDGTSTGERSIQEDARGAGRAGRLHDRGARGRDAHRARLAARDAELWQLVWRADARSVCYGLISALEPGLPINEGSTGRSRSTSGPSGRC
jgi:hypothetical protein